MEIFEIRQVKAVKTETVDIAAQKQQPNGRLDFFFGCVFAQAINKYTPKRDGKAEGNVLLI